MKTAEEKILLMLGGEGGNRSHDETDRFLCSLSEWRGLSQEIAEILVEAGWGGRVYANLDSFEGLSEDFMAKLMADPQVAYLLPKE